MRYRKRPVVVEAVRWIGLNRQEIEDFCGNSADFQSWGDGIVSLVVNTHEGTRKALTGDFIVRDTNGEYYPCSHEIFKQKYECAE